MDRLTILNAFGHSSFEREHRLVFETSAPSNTPMPRGDLNRLYTQQESGDGSVAGGRSEKYDQVYDRLQARKEMYEKETAGQRANIEAVIKASITTDATADTAYKQANELIARLTPDNVYSNTYTAGDGSTRTFENGRYATLNSIEARYQAIEAKIQELENRVKERNGGNLPAGVRPFAQRLEAFRVSQTLNLNGTPPGQTSVDIRSYPRPFARDADVANEAERSRAAYQLLRIPANFRFPDTFGGQLVTEGISGGAAYIRLPNERAATMGGQSFQVEVMGPDNRVIGTVTANVTIYDQVANRIRITYTNTQAVTEYYSKQSGGSSGPDGDPELPGLDGPVPPENPEAVAKKAREEFTKVAETNLKDTEAAAKALEAAAAAREADPAGYLAALETYLAAMTTEAAHLEQPQDALAWPEGDEVRAAHVARLAVLRGDDGTGGEVQARTLEVNNVRAYVEFHNKAAIYAAETDTALAGLSTDTPPANDPAAWEARIAELEGVLGTLDLEASHLALFIPEGDIYNGATDAQRGLVETRTKTVNDAVDAQTKALAEAREGRDVAEKNKFHEDWEGLNSTAEANKAGYEESVTTEAPVGTRVSEITDYIASLEAEEQHLNACNREIYNPEDATDTERLKTYTDRQEAIGEALTTLRIAAEQLAAYQTFEQTAVEKRRDTDTADALVQIVQPADNAVEEWTTQVSALEGYRDALALELSHLTSFLDSPAFEGATPTERQAVADRITAIEEEQKTNAAELVEATEKLAEAKRIVFHEEWLTRNEETNKTRGEYDAVDLENATDRVEALTIYLAAAKAEYAHLSGAEAEVPFFEADDPRATAMQLRAEYLEDDTEHSIDALTTKLEQLTAARDFLNNADVYEGETDAAFNLIPEDPTDPVDQAGWEAKIAATQEYVSRLTSEQLHLATFAGSDAETGATENQAKGIRQRLEDVEAALKSTEDTEMPRLQEERNKAECNKFEADWTDLKTNAEGAQLAYEATLTDGSDPGTRLSALNTAISALQNESDFLGTLNAEIHAPGDERLGTYYARINTLNEDIPNLNITAEQLGDLVAYEAEWETKFEATETAFNAIPDVPTARGDVQGWTDYKTAVEAYNGVVLDEGLHMAALTVRPGFAVATPDEVSQVYNRFMFLTGEGMDNFTKMANAERGLITATNDKFEDDWNPLKAASDGGEIPWNGVLVTDDMPADQKLATLNVYRTALQAELAHLNGAAALPAETGGPVRPDYATRLGVVMTAIGELNTKEGELNSLSAFEQEQTKLSGESEAAQKTAEAAAAAPAPLAADLPSWTGRRDAVQRYITALTAEQAHLQTLAGIPGNNVITANDRTDVETRLKDIEAALKTQEGVLKTQQDGVDIARVDTITSIDIAGPVRLPNRTATATRTINRFQSITVTKGSSSMTIQANQSSSNPEFPLFTREPGSDTVTIGAGERSSGTYEVNVAGKTMTIVIPALPPRPRPR